jgi:pyruvate,water dikinase
MRRIYCALGRNLARRGIVQREDDIFFLTPGEILSLQQEEMPCASKEIVAERRREYEENCRLPSFPVILDDGGEKRYVPYEADGTLTILAGLPVCPGCARGPARVILPGTDDIRVQPGEILVIPYADPGWSPYFAISAGIVMDMGGMLSHGSIIAREYGIPTVVNVGPATEIIRPGQVIEVDGSRGIVTLSGEGGN